MANCLVTGGAGFIGSHLSEALLERGDKVIVVDDESTGSRNNLREIENNPNFQFVSGSVSDPELVEKLVSEVDQVYHLAAAVGVALISNSPIQTIERNIYPTELLLAEVEKHNAAGRPVKMFLASTSEVYGKNPKETWTEEDDLVFGATTRPRWSYGASKAIDEFLALAYWHQNKTPVVIARFFNVVGPRQTGTYGMVLPRFVDAVMAGESPLVHNDGTQVRCFGHVDDVIAGILKLMDCEDAVGEVFNIGSDHPVSILQLAQMVIQAIDPSVKVKFQTYEEAYSDNFEDILRRVPDLSKIKKTVDYQAKHQLDDIIADVIKWKQDT